MKHDLDLLGVGGLLLDASVIEGPTIKTDAKANAIGRSGDVLPVKSASAPQSTFAAWHS